MTDPTQQMKRRGSESGPTVPTGGSAWPGHSAGDTLPRATPWAVAVSTLSGAPVHQFLVGPPQRDRDRQTLSPASRPLLGTPPPTPVKAAPPGVLVGGGNGGGKPLQWGGGAGPQMRGGQLWEVQAALGAGEVREVREEGGC